MADVKAWREGAPGEPKFPETFDVIVPPSREC